ncbi:MAG TPA: efflux RND transporter periplasmic adaptor subunit [Gemmataceae bacterium]|nr:efflux RND transporter periplasmic adaptor subunit [Gemmataceae bacterium]
MIDSLSFHCGAGLLLAFLFSIVGCGRAPTETPSSSPPAVTVSYPLQRQVEDYEEFTGRTAAIDSVQVRARVSGYLMQINFKEGAEVNENDVLYEIDPRPYQASLDQAEAQVRLQEANLRYQEALYNRDVKLTGTQAVSQEELQKDLAARDTARASVTSAQANLEQARLNLSWTKVLAPISGRIGRTLVTRGNLVIADQTLLTTLVSMDPMYAYFDVDERTMLRVQQLIREGKFHSTREGARVPVWLGLATESDYPHEGIVDFVNNQVDPSTGTLLIRGSFPNPKPPVGVRVLSPGLFVRIRVAIGPPYQAVLVNERALGTDQNLKFVYVVDDQNRALRRDVELGAQYGALQAIKKGLQPNERVIVSGLQRVRPGIVVNPKLAKMPATGAASPPQNAASSMLPSQTPPQASPTSQQSGGSTQTKQ